MRGGNRRFRLLPKTILLPMELLLLFLQALLPIRRRRRPLLPPVILLLPLSQRALSRRCRTCWIPRRPMDHHSGHALPLLTAFLAPRSLCSRTERCVALLAILSLCKNADRSATGPCAFCTRPALVIGVPALCVSTVKKRAPPRSRAA